MLLEAAFEGFAGPAGTHNPVNIDGTPQTTGAQLACGLVWHANGPRGPRERDKWSARRRTKGNSRDCSSCVSNGIRLSVCQCSVRLCAPLWQSFQSATMGCLVLCLRSDNFSSGNRVSPDSGSRGGGRLLRQHYTV